MVPPVTNAPQAVIALALTAHQSCVPLDHSVKKGLFHVLHAALGHLVSIKERPLVPHVVLGLSANKGRIFARSVPPMKFLLPAPMMMAKTYLVPLAQQENQLSRVIYSALLV